MINMAPKKHKVSWANSKAKAQLKADILSEAVKSTDEPKDVYAMHEIYKKWPQGNFSGNYRRLQRALERDYDRMAQDCADYGHDLAIVDVLRANNPPAKPSWHKSPARALLKKDMDEGKHKDLTPKELHKTKEEYQAFPLTKFRNHIYQEADTVAKRDWRQKKKKKKLLKWVDADA